MRMPSNFLLVFFALTTAVDAAMRIAIVSEDSGKLPDMLTSELSACHEIELVERAGIAKIISEQKIATSILNEKVAFSLGKLIPADLFVVIETEVENKNPIGIIVFDAHTGVRYWDSALPEAKDGLPPAKFAADAVRQALDKRQKAADASLKYVSLLSVRNIDLPREKDYLCNAICTLLMSRLGNTPGLAVLERTHLEWLNKERGLPVSEHEGNLLGSMIMIDVQVSRTEAKAEPENSNDEGFVNVSVFLNGEKTTSFDLSPVRISSGADRLAASIAEKAGAGLLRINISPSQEAKRFYSEYRFLEGHKEFVAAHEKIETAVALDPEISKDHYRISLSRMSKEKFHQDISMALGYAERAFQLEREIYGNSRIDAISVFLGLCVDREFNPEVQSRIRSLHREVVRVRREEIERRTGVNIDTEISDDKIFVSYCDFIDRSLLITYLNKNERIDNFRALYTAFFRKSNEFFSKRKEPDGESSRTLAYAVRPLLSNLFYYPPPPNPVFAVKHRLVYKEIYGYMVQNTWAPIRVFGELGLLAMEHESESHGKMRSSQFCRLANKMVMDEIDALPKGESNAPCRYICYEAMILPYFDRTPKEELRQVRNEIADFMMARNEIHCVLAQRLFPEFDGPLDATEDSELCVAFLKMLDSDEVTVLEWDGLHHAKKQALRMFLTENHGQISNHSIVSGRPSQNWHERFTRISNCYGNKYSEWSHVVAPCLYGNSTVYAIALTRTPTRAATLLKIDIPSRKIFPMCTINTEWSEYDIKQTGNSFISNNSLFFASRGDGITVFDLDRTRLPLKINKSSGLPSDRILSFTCLYDTIYIYTGNSDDPSNKRMQSHIVSYNIKTGAMTTLASSSRKEKIGPFDGLDYPAYISSMCPDEKRSRILMTVQFVQNEGPHNLSGLWAFNIKSGDWTRLFSRKGVGGIHKDRIKPHGDAFMYHSDMFCATLDFERNSHELLFSAKRAHPNFKPDKSKLIQLAQELSPPYIVTENFMWSGNFPATSLKMSSTSTIGRIAFDGSRVDRLPQVDNTFWHYTCFLEMTEDKKHIIWCNAHDIWLIELKPEDL